MHRHHQSRFIVRFDSPKPKASERNTEKAAKDSINAKLRAAGETKVSVSAIIWNRLDNCIVLSRTDEDAALFQRHSELIAKELTTSNDRTFVAHPDRPWQRVVLDGVATGHDFLENTAVTTPMDEIIDELRDDNPAFRNIELKDAAKWMCTPSVLSGKMHSTIVLSLGSEADKATLLEASVLTYAGKLVFVKAYRETKPIRQCTRCWSLDHSISECKSTRGRRCRFCNGDHSDHDHKCKECIRDGLKCSHTDDYTCQNCKGRHPSDSRSCPSRIAARGRDNNIANSSGKKRKTKKRAKATKGVAKSPAESLTAESGDDGDYEMLSVKIASFTSFGMTDAHEPSRSVSEDEDYLRLKEVVDKLAVKRDTFPRGDAQDWKGNFASSIVFREELVAVLGALPEEVNDAMTEAGWANDRMMEVLFKKMVKRLTTQSLMEVVEL